ncbi:MAG: CapA family protein [Gemmatimonadales bacterium]
MIRVLSVSEMRVLAFALVTLISLYAPASAQAPHADASGDISVALAGDAIITRKLSPFAEPEFLQLRDVIREAAAAFVNLEILFHNYEDDIIPQAQSGGTYMRARPEIAQELAWMGFDLVSRANNHTMDYGVGGMRATTRAVEAAGLVHAGAGENLALARAPAYLETPGGRVALISVASTFADPARAGPQRKDHRGRPGLSPLRYRTQYVIPRPQLDVLRRIREGLGFRISAQAERVSFMGATFVAGDDYAVLTEPHEGDLAEIVASVKDAKRQANWVIVSSHSHEGAGDREVPAQFLVTFARAVIEAGADIFVGHGPHVLRGIEIHRGRPIFYSLANFIFENETVERQPADNYDSQGLQWDALPSDFYDRRNQRRGGGWPADPAYWESVVPVVSFSGGELEAVRLYPVTLGHGLQRPQYGRPLLARGDLARKIIENVRRLSEPFGTRVEFDRGIGVIAAGR